MRNLRNGLVLIIFGIFIFGVVLSKALNSQVTNSQRPEEPIDVNHFPVADSTEPLPADPNKRLKRQKKNKKYDNRYALSINENTEKIFTITGWELGLPAFPVAKSAAIAMGEITDARAYLSDDRSSVYSEFDLRISRVFKNDIQHPLAAGSLITIDRIGGRVRFPSGKTIASLVDYQDMPQMGGNYLFFLIHRFDIDETDDLYILTGYEFRGGHVFPLDKLGPKHPIGKYEGAEATLFLADLNAAVVNPR